MPKTLQERRAQVLRLHRMGMTQKAIADQVGTTQPSVSKIINRQRKLINAVLEGETGAQKVILDSLLEIVQHGDRDQDRIKAAEQVNKMLGLNAPEKQEVRQTTGPQKIELEFVNVPGPGPEIRYNPFPPEE